MKIIFILFLSISTTLFPQASRYSINSDLPPLKISYEEYLSILNKAKKYIESVNVLDTIYDKPELKLVIDHSEMSLTYYNLDTDKIMRDIPQISNKAYFSYNSYGNKISILSINLGDSYRNIEVEGKSYENCQALISLLEKEFSHYSISFGGSTFIYSLVATGCQK